MQNKPLIFQAAEMYALCVCGGLFLRDMQIVIEKKLMNIAVKKGYVNGEIQEVIQKTIKTCTTDQVVETKPRVPVTNKLTQSEFVVAYRAFQFAERIKELSAEIEVQHAKIDKLQVKPDDFEGTKKDWIESQKEAISHERFIRDEKSKLRTQYQNEETTEYIEEKFKKEAIKEFERSGGILSEAAKLKRIEKLKSMIFHEDSADEQFYPTPANIIRNYLIPNANITDGMSILEPSAGKGDIADMLRELYPNSPIDTIELSPIRNEYLRLQGYNVIGTDFMLTEPQEQYDRIVMNPPFMRTVSIAHVTRAFKLFLKKGGTLVALINAGAYTNERELDSIKFRKRIVEKYGTTIGINVKEYNEGIERAISVHIAVVVLTKPLIDEKKSTGEILPTPVVGAKIEEIRNGKQYKVIEIGEEDFLARTSSGTEVLIDKEQFYADEWEIVDTEEKYSIPERSGFVDADFKEVGFLTAREDLTNTNVPKYINHFVPVDENGKSKILDHVIFGANYGIRSLEKRGGFLNSDGTGTGKTAQQLLVALYYAKTYNKPVLILTETDSIIEQSFFGDAKNLLGLSVPDARSEKVQKEIKRSKNYKGLYDKFESTTKSDFTSNSKVKVRRYNPNIGLQPGINIGTYYDLSQLDWSNEPLSYAYDKSKRDRIKADDYYAEKRKEINNRFGKKLSTEEKKIKKELLDSLNDERGNDVRYSAVLVAEDAWTERQRELLKVWTQGVSLLLLDECQNLKNTGGNTLRANRAQLIIEDVERVAFYSATPSDKAGDIFYLKRAGIYRDENEFERLMHGIGHYKSKPVYDKQGRLIRRSEWKSDSKFPSMEKLSGVSRIFEMLTEDGGMLKRELQLTNLTSVMVDMNVPARAHELMEEIEDAIADEKCGTEPGCQPPKALIMMEQRRGLEPFKVQRAIEITKKEIAEGRNVVIFCDLKDDGDKEKSWGGKKEGVVRILKERLGEMYGDDMVGVIIGTNSEYEKQEKYKNIQSFQKGGKRIIIATIGSGGTGISLDDVLGNAPRTMVIITAPLSSIKAVQVLGRIVRAKTRSRSMAYFLFADLDIDVYQKNLLASKMLMLGAIVAGEISQLSPKQLEAIEAGGEESAADFIDQTSVSKTDADGKKKKVHKFFSHKVNDWIDGKTLPQNKPYSVRKLKETISYWDKSIFMQIKADSKANIDKFAAMYASDIAKYNFTRESDRYMGTFYKAPYSDMGWNFLLNILKPEQQEYIVIPGQVFNVGDEVRITEDNISYNIVAGSIGEVVQVRPRSKYYLYDVMFDGMLAQSIEQEILTFTENERYDADTSKYKIGDIYFGSYFGANGNQLWKYFKIMDIVSSPETTQYKVGFDWNISKEQLDVLVQGETHDRETYLNEEGLLREIEKNNMSLYYNDSTVDSEEEEDEEMALNGLGSLDNTKGSHLNQAIELLLLSLEKGVYTAEQGRIFANKLQMIAENTGKRMLHTISEYNYGVVLALAGSRKFKDITKEMVKRFSSPDYSWKIRDYLENKKFETVKDLAREYFRLRKAAHADAYTPLSIGFFNSLNYRTGNYSDGTYEFQMKNDPDFIKLRELGIDNTNKDKELEKYFEDVRIDEDIWGKYNVFEKLAVSLGGEYSDYLEPDGRTQPSIRMTAEGVGGVQHEMRIIFRRDGHYSIMPVADLSSHIYYDRLLKSLQDNVEKYIELGLKKWNITREDLKWRFYPLSTTSKETKANPLEKLADKLNGKVIDGSTLVKLKQPHDYHDYTKNRYIEFNINVDTEYTSKHLRIPSEFDALSEIPIIAIFYDDGSYSPRYKNARGSENSTTINLDSHVDLAYELISKAMEELGLHQSDLARRSLSGIGEKAHSECPPRTENGEYCITPACIEYLEECIAAQPDTKSLWLDEEGDYVTERWELHNRIIADIMKSAHCIRRDKPIAILTGGASGSGKSTFLKKFRSYLTSDKIVKIDIDSFRDYLPEYKGWNANATQSEVRDIYNRLLDNLHSSDCRYDIILDGTMNKSKNYIPLIERLKSYGYQVFVIYIKVSKETSEKRVRERYKRSGRYVPQFVIDEIFQNGEAPMREIVKKTDGYIIVDNENEGKIIERGGKLLPKDRKYSSLQDNISELIPSGEIEQSNDVETNDVETNDVETKDVKNKVQTLTEEDNEMPNTEPDLTPEDFGFYNAQGITAIRPNYIRLNRTRELLDKIARPFRMLIWGKQGSGKSSLSLMFSEDMSVNGKVLHLLTEEKVSSGRLGALAGRLNINARNIIFNDAMDYSRLREFLSKNPQVEFVTIDSVNRLQGGSEDLLMSMWEEFPNVSFVHIGQSTKDGKTHSAFPTLAFNVDTVIRVDKLVAVAEKHRDGRSGVEFSVLGKRAQRSSNQEMTFQGFKI